MKNDLIKIVNERFDWADTGVGNLDYISNWEEFVAEEMAEYMYWEDMQGLLKGSE